MVGVPPPDFLVVQDAVGPSQRAALSVPWLQTESEGWKVVKMEVPPRKLTISMENPHVSIGNTSSKGGCSAAMLVFCSSILGYHF